jgi:hypothetical protein
MFEVLGLLRTASGTGRCEKIDFAEIWLGAKCMPMAQRSLIELPGEIRFVA